MATKVGSVLIEIKGDTARLVKDMELAKKKVSQAVNTMKKTILGLAAAYASLNTAKAFKNMIDDAIDAADKAGKLAEKLGMTSKELTKLQYAAHYAAVSQDKLNAGLSAMIRRITNFIRTGKGAAAHALQELGISADFAKKNFSSTEKAFEILAERLNKLPDGYRKTAIAQDLFSKNAADMLRIINMGSKEIKRLGDEAERFGIAVPEAIAKMAASYHDTIDRMKAKFEGFKKTLSYGVLPALLAAAKTSDEWFQKAFGNGKNLAEKFGEKATKAIIWVIKAVGFLKDSFTGIKLVIKGIELGIEYMAKGFGVAFDKIIAGINLLIKAYNALPDWIKPGSGKLSLIERIDIRTYDAAIKETKKEIRDLINNLHSGRDAAKKFEQDFIKNLKKVQEEANKASEKTSKNAQHAYKITVDIIDKNSKKISKNTKKNIDNVTGKILDLTKTTKQATNELAESIKNIWQHAFENLQDIFADWIRNFKVDLTSIKNLFKDTVSQMVGAWISGTLRMSMRGIIPGIGMGAVGTGAAMGKMGMGLTSGANISTFANLSQSISNIYSGLKNFFYGGLGNTKTWNIIGAKTGIVDFTGKGGWLSGHTWSTLGNVLGYAGFGYTVGNLLNKIWKGSSTGSSLGGAVGALGFLANPVAGIAGLLGGSFLGSLFGHGRKPKMIVKVNESLRYIPGQGFIGFDPFQYWNTSAPNRWYKRKMKVPSDFQSKLTKTFQEILDSYAKIIDTVLGQLPQDLAEKYKQQLQNIDFKIYFSYDKTGKHAGDVVNQAINTFTVSIYNQLSSSLNSMIDDLKRTLSDEFDKLSYFLSKDVKDNFEEDIDSLDYVLGKISSKSQLKKQLELLETTFAKFDNLKSYLTMVNDIIEKINNTVKQSKLSDYELQLESIHEKYKEMAKTLENLGIAVENTNLSLAEQIEIQKLNEQQLSPIFSTLESFINSTKSIVDDIRLSYLKPIEQEEFYAKRYKELKQQLLSGTLSNEEYQKTFNEFMNVAKEYSRQISNTFTSSDMAIKLKEGIIKDIETFQSAFASLNEILKENNITDLTNLNLDKIFSEITQFGENVDINKYLDMLNNTKEDKFLNTELKDLFINYVTGGSKLSDLHDTLVNIEKIQMGDYSGMLKTLKEKLESFTDLQKQQAYFKSHESLYIKAYESTLENLGIQSDFANRIATQMAKIVEKNPVSALSDWPVLTINPIGKNYSIGYQTVTFDKDTFNSTIASQITDWITKNGIKDFVKLGTFDVGTISVDKIKQQFKDITEKLWQYDKETLTKYLFAGSKNQWNDYYAFWFKTFNDEFQNPSRNLTAIQYLPQNENYFNDTLNFLLQRRYDVIEDFFKAFTEKVLEKLENTQTQVSSSSADRPIIIQIDGKTVAEVVNRQNKMMVA